MLSRYTPKLNGSNISNLPIDRVYSIYVHYRKFKGKPTYPYAINPYLQDTKVFNVCVLTIGSPFMWGILMFYENVMNEKKEEKIDKWGN